MNCNTRTLTRFLMSVGMLAVLLMATNVQAAPQMGYGGPGGGGGGGRGGGGGGPLSTDEIAAITAAIDEEYLARNSYLAVMNRLGPISPFSNIARSELAHVSAIANLFTKYGLPVPSDPKQVFGDSASVSTRQQACGIGIQVEVADIELYDALFAAGNITHGDIINVFTNLQSASINNHLPAFTACS
jgi:hypothetical protein